MKNRDYANGGYVNIDVWGDLNISNDTNGDSSLNVGPQSSYLSSYWGNVNDQVVQIGGGSAISTVFDVQFEGTSVFRVDTDNSRVGIRQTEPASIFSVNGNASIGTYSTTAAPTNGLIVSGNVGIGTSSPATTLDVNGTTTVRGTVRTRAGGDLSMGSFTYSSAGSP